MIGVSFSDRGDELQFARIEPGKSHNGVTEYYWRAWPEGNRELADAITEVIGHRSREITGFTLFWNGDRREGRQPGWQMSVRRKDEDGWSITRVPDAKARSVFDLLQNSGHPDGPWTLPGAAKAVPVEQQAVKAVADLETEIGRLEAAFDRLTSAAEAYSL